MSKIARELSRINGAAHRVPAAWQESPADEPYQGKLPPSVTITFAIIFVLLLWGISEMALIHKQLAVIHQSGTAAAFEHNKVTHLEQQLARLEETEAGRYKTLSEKYDSDRQMFRQSRQDIGMLKNEKQKLAAKVKQLQEQLAQRNVRDDSLAKQIALLWYSKAGGGREDGTSNK